MTKQGQSLFEVFTVCLKLGLTSFGGPIAHLGYFREEYVNRKKWISEQGYADLVALCQFLPGPASSQVGIAIGIERAGLLGGLLAWIGFTAPSAIALALFAFFLKGSGFHHAGWLHGLILVAVAVVAQAVWGMSRTLAPDRPRGTLAIAAAALSLLVPHAFIQVLILVVSGLYGRLFLPKQNVIESRPMRVPISKRTGIICWVLFFCLLFGGPLLENLIPSHWLQIFDSFYRSGALVFGGGHVVLPLLQHAVVQPGFVTDSEFIAGYGATQAVPGPLFTFAAYLGAVMHPSPNGFLGAAFALLAIFLPAYLLVVGALPFWNTIRVHPGFQSAVRGINAGVVGILGAALYNPVWTSAIKNGADFSVALVAFGLLVLWKLPPWMVVLFGAVSGMVMEKWL